MEAESAVIFAKDFRLDSRKISFMENIDYTIEARPGDEKNSIVVNIQMSRELYECATNTIMSDEFYTEVQERAKNLTEEQLNEMSAKVLREVLTDERFRDVEKIDAYFYPKQTTENIKIEIQ